MQFSPNVLIALTQAVAQLVCSGGALANRLSQACRYLELVRPADLDAALWSDLVAVRGIVKRGAGNQQLRRAAGKLVDLLGRYASQRPNSVQRPWRAAAYFDQPLAAA